MKRRKKAADHPALFGHILIEEFGIESFLMARLYRNGGTPISERAALRKLFDQASSVLQARLGSRGPWPEAAAGVAREIRSHQRLRSLKLLGVGQPVAEHQLLDPARRLLRPAKKMLAERKQQLAMLSHEISNAMIVVDEDGSVTEDEIEQEIADRREDLERVRRELVKELQRLEDLCRAVEPFSAAARKADQRAVWHGLALQLAQAIEAAYQREGIKPPSRQSATSPLVVAVQELLGLMSQSRRPAAIVKALTKAPARRSRSRS